MFLDEPTTAIDVESKEKDLSWTLMQFLQSSKGIDFIQLLPGLMGMSVLFGTTSILAVTITFERKGRSFNRLIIASYQSKRMVVALGLLLWRLLGLRIGLILRGNCFN